MLNLTRRTEETHLHPVHPETVVVAGTIVMMTTTAIRCSTPGLL
jgi:hypothetical protein